MELFQADPEEAKVQACDFGFFPALSSHDPEQHYLTVTAAKAVFDLYIPNQTFLSYEYVVQQSTSPWLLYHLGQEAVIDGL